MNKSYTEIFNQRGHAYHHAMLQYPLARADEFRHILELADLQTGHTVLDMPSGGGYLKQWIAPSVKLILVETSRQFIRETETEPNESILLCHRLQDTLLPDACADRIISLAGLHHLDDKPALYREVCRLLKPGGMFCLADASEGSAEAQFLNGFVHRHNSQGHEGIFLDGQTPAELAGAGLRVRYDDYRAYAWHFDSPPQMAQYCQLMFGMDRATLPEIEKGIHETLGFVLRDGQCHMNWGLRFLQAVKA